VSARLLSVKSHTFTQTVPTTGHGHTQAQQAQGTLTFYNAAPYAQTVAAGTVLTGADGVELVTAQVAYLPAGNLPDVGMATVAAQAVQVGPQGNIAPLDLNGLCCVAGVSVKNTDAFSGGQNARNYTVVARQDVEAVAGPESTTLTQAVQASLQGEVRPSEQLASPAQCHPSVSTNHPIGSEATHVTITLTVTCQGEVYDAQAVQQLASAALGEQARTTLGAGYSAQGPIKTSVTQVATTEAAHGTLSLLVSAQGTWSYQFSSAQISQVSKRIAGLSRQEALHLLKQDGHIQAVSITETWNATSVPTDPAHIQIMVLDVVNG
jgi:VCBS repeat-containing protein